MKLIQSLIIACIFSLNIFSQENKFVEVLYSQQYEMEFDKVIQTIPSEQRNSVAQIIKNELDNGIFLEFIFKSNGNESVYQIVEKLDNSQSAGYGIFAKQFYESEKGIMYKNLAENIYLKPFTLPINNTTFLIKDKLPVFNWEIIGEDKTINNYKTIKAKAIDNGVQITAWYAPEIILRDGPSIYYNLPGLILKVVIEQQGTIITSLAKNIKILKNMPKIEKPRKGKIVSEAEFTEEIKKFQEKIKDLNPQGVDTAN